MKGGGGGEGGGGEGGGEGGEHAQINKQKDDTKGEFKDHLGLPYLTPQVSTDNQSPYFQLTQTEDQTNLSQVQAEYPW